MKYLFYNILKEIAFTTPLVQNVINKAVYQRWVDTLNLTHYPNEGVGGWQATEKPDIFQTQVLEVGRQQKNQP